jgi:hypothetical protein
LGYLTLLIGENAADLLDELGLDEEELTSFEKVFKGYENFFSPKCNIYIQRMKFHQMQQREDQKFDQFVAEVRKIAGTCEFNNKEEQIRDRIVIGMRNSKIKEKVIFEQEFSLVAVIQKVRLWELQHNEYMKLNAENLKIDKISEDSSKRNKCIKSSSNYVKSASTKESKDSQLDECDAKCNEGGMVDAMKKNEESNKGDFIVNSDSVKYKVSSLLWYKNLKISGKMIRFKLDTGAQINTITLSIVKQFRDDFKILPSQSQLKSYSGGNIEPTGKVILPISKNLHYEEFQVLKGNFEPLLGLKTCIKLNLISRIDTVDLKKHLHNDSELIEFKKAL